MRERMSRRPRRLQVMFAGAVALSMALGASAAWAQNAKDDDDEPFDAQFWRGMMRELGLKREEAGIEYRERAPLVVPPSRTLPPPRPEGVVNNPAWPKDPDVKKRQEATASPSAKAKLRGDRVMESLRPLSPSEIEAGRVAARPNGDPATPSAEDNLRQMTPEQLGAKKSIWDSFLSAVGPERPEYAPFSGEAPRTALTAPPVGYQTPSPAQPYGLTPSNSGQKPMTMEDRQSPAPK